MKPSGSWLGRLIMAGSCLAWVGCGGSDVPDPDSDSSAAAEKPVKVVDKGAEPAAEPAAAPKAPQAPAKPEAEATGPRPPAPAQEVAAQPETAPAATPGPAPAVAEAEKPAPAASAEAPAPAAAEPAATKGDASGTEEMMRIAAASPASPPAATDAPPAASTPAPSGPTNPPVASAVPGPAGGPANPGVMPGSNGGGSAAPGGRARGGFGGMDGAPGAPGGSGAAEATPAGAFNNPATAVDAFLKALKAKNKDRLAEATARRSATEAVEKHRKIFAEIVEGSISDVELDEMAAAMDGYQVVGELPAKSTGRIGVLIGKQRGRDQLQRTVIARKERDGWKVMDIEGVYDFKPVGSFRRGGRR